MDCKYVQSRRHFTKWQKLQSKSDSQKTPKTNSPTQVSGIRFHSECMLLYFMKHSKFSSTKENESFFKIQVQVTII